MVTPVNPTDKLHAELKVLDTATVFIDCEALWYYEKNAPAGLRDALLMPAMRRLFYSFDAYQKVQITTENTRENGISLCRKITARRVP